MDRRKSAEVKPVTEGKASAREEREVLRLMEKKSNEISALKKLLKALKQNS